MEKSSYSFETVWAALQETGAKLEQSRIEADKRNAEFEQKFEKSRVEADKRNVEFEQKFEKSRSENDKIIKDLSMQIGGMANSNGAYAEEFFYNALLHGKRNLFGEVFEEVVKGNIVTINKGYADEYDILLVNGKAICVVEVKYKADSSDLPQRVLRKAQTFRVNFPQHKDKKVYLALAGMSFNPLTEKACKENGIAILKQVGDAMVVTDENLKVF
jgi:hypothetical protein